MTKVYTYLADVPAQRRHLGDWERRLEGSDPYVPIEVGS
jgi:hypothetical protein